jgi:hypothetical protein
MAHLKLLAGGSALALALSLGAAQAQVTAEDVWAGWKDYYASFGAGVTTGSEVKDGSTLVLTDVAFSGGAEGNTFAVTIPEMRLTELGDGRVEMTLSPEVPISSKSTSPEGEVADMVMKLTQTDMKMVVSGQPADMNYDFTAPTMAVKVDSLTVDGAAVPLSVDVALTGNTGTYNLKTAGAKVLTSQFATEAVTFAMSATDPTAGGTFNLNGSLSGLGGTSNATIPEGVNFEDMNAALKAGLLMDGTFTYAGGTYAVDFQDAEQSMVANATGSGGGLNFKMSQDGLNYGGNGSGMQVSATGSQIPFPIEFAMGESAFNLAMPVVKSDTARPFALLMKVVDLSLSDGIWGMVDPGAQLPREPLTMVIDIAGTAKLLQDIMDPANAGSTDVPGELETVSLNQLQVKLAGAELTGTGAATVDNSTPVPKPVGAVDLKLTGANALIDKLVAIGLIPEDQAMGARMMMGMFAVPAGDDVLTSKIEFKEDGGIYANGQRVQ